MTAAAGPRLGRQMQVFDGFASARGAITGCAVALGNFDGVHLGHQALFAAAIRRAHARGRPAVAATFDPHPGKVLKPELAPKLLLPLQRKLQLMEAVGLDAVVLQRFDPSYASLSASEFLERDLFGLEPGDIVVGPDFTYGRARQGTVATLRAACEQRGVGLVAVEPVTCSGVVVSSSKVREFVAEGRLGAAEQLLGRPFDLCGHVASGRGRGRTIGFPTANLVAENEVQPALGVYAVRAFVGDRWWGGAANIGQKPTFDEQDITVEIHLFDFAGELYGAHLCVEFLERLRGEQRFGSVQALMDQIARDCERAREIVAAAPPPGKLSPRPTARR